VINNDGQIDVKAQANHAIPAHNACASGLVDESTKFNLRHKRATLCLHTTLAPAWENLTES
jgi:hypothetical protein